MLSLPDFKEKKWVVINSLEGQKMQIQNDNILVKNANEEVVLQLTCYRIFTVWIVGASTLTSVLLERSKKFGFSIFIMNQNFKLHGCWAAPTEGNFLLRKKQYDYNNIQLAKYLVNLKILNQAKNIKNIRIKNDEVKQSISDLINYSEKIGEVTELSNLLGIEGHAAKLYFKLYFKNLNWKGRKPRVKMDSINTLLDIGYTMLFNFIDCLLNLYGFDTYVGVYHKQFYQRKSLVCDLVEPFRCIIDKQILKSFGLKQIQNSDFQLIKGQYFLKFGKNKVVQKFFIEAIYERKEELFIFIQAYYRAFMRDKHADEFPTFEI
jgi:CRISP-associated protein Cas1